MTRPDVLINNTTMSRLGRSYTPCVIHYVIIRGIERKGKWGRSSLQGWRRDRSPALHFLSPRLLATSHGQVAFTGLFPLDSRFGSTVCTGGVEDVDDFPCFLSGFIQQVQFGGIGNIRRCAGGVNEQFALVLCRFFWLFRFVPLTGTAVIRGRLVGGRRRIVFLPNIFLGAFTLIIVEYTYRTLRIVSRKNRLLSIESVTLIFLDTISWGS